MTNGFFVKVISRSPSSSGIYIFKSGRKNLYIGKAANLKARLRSYLRTADPRVQKMLSLARTIKLELTDSGIEALILESQYIKKYKPVFNIIMRDDKQYGFVDFTKEEFPKIFITHQPFDSAERKRRVVLIPSKNNRSVPLRASHKNYIGPFTDISALKTTLRYLRRIFPYCTCRKPHNNFCLNYHIGKCPGFCCLKSITELQITNYKLRNYRKNVKAVRNILLGKKGSLLKKLEKEMVVLGKKEKFEEAIGLKNKIEKIKKIFENARIIKSIGISKYQYKNILKEIKKSLGIRTTPIRIEAFDVANIQGKYAVGAMVVFALQNDSEQANYKPDKSEYRKFKIRHPKYKKPLLQNKHDRGNIAAIQEPINDTAMLKEILIRRFNHPEWPMPDLILVDGGKAQLNATYSIITKLLNYPITVLALTKNEKHKGEKIFIAGKQEPILLSQLPLSAKNLLLQVNSEAHRFAINYYRKLSRFALYAKHN